MAGIHERYERLLEAGPALAADLSLPATLQRIVELAADLTGARYGALGVLGRDGGITDFITTGVTAAERSTIGHIPVGRGHRGRVPVRGGQRPRPAPGGHPGLSTAILAGTDPGELLGLVVGHARALVGADLATLALPTGDDRMAVEAADGLLADELLGTVFPVEGSVTGEVIRTGKAVVLADAGVDARSAQPIVRAGVGPAVFVPLACAAAPSAP